MAQNTAKKWYQSKTIILNIITIILGVTGALDPQTLNDLGITSKQFIGGLGLLTTILNIILRTQTATPIAGTAKATEVNNNSSGEAPAQ